MDRHVGTGDRTGLLQRLDRVFRRTGATPPGGDARPSHGAEMEGYFWRVTDVAAGRVLVVLCGVNRHPAGDWATVAVAAHPGGFVRAAALDAAWASPDRLEVSAGNGAFVADAAGVHVDLGAGAAADLTLAGQVAWPLRLGGGGVFSAVPWLGQYWHPHVLGGRATGTATIGGEAWAFDGAEVYAEKNWGAGFPERWWWGQAQGFDRPDVCVAFGGGLLTAGALSVAVGGVVARVGDRVVRIAPPFGRVRTETDGTRWEVRAAGVGQRMHLVGTATGEPHVLPVPLPAQRRNVDTDFEHLAATLSVELSGRVAYEGTSNLAALEIGYRPDPDARGGGALPGWQGLARDAGSERRPSAR
jgi:tocopherol cyclase